MSAILNRWRTRNGEWRASAWFSETEQFGGPFDTEEEAIAWQEAQRPKRCPWCDAEITAADLRPREGTAIGCKFCIDWRAQAFCSIRNAPDPQCEGCRGTGWLPIRARNGEPVQCDCWAWCDNHDRLCGLDEPATDDWLADGTAVWSADGQTRGVIRGRRACQLEGCTGMAVRVIWPDGKVTWPCSKGLEAFDGRELVIAAG